MNLVVVVVGLVAGLIALGRPRRLPHAEAGQLPAPTVLIPARNEEAVLPELLETLHAQTLRPRIVVVADDSSSDDTATVAWTHGAEIERVEPLPDGWFGKPWATQSAFERLDEQLADDDVVVLLDADVRLAPDGLASIVAATGTHDVVSVLPQHRPGSPVEQLSALFNIVSAMGIGLGTDAPNAIVGPVIACSAGTYRSVGGHAAVRDEIAEDVALGQRWAAEGRSLGVFTGGNRVWFRMYPDGWNSLVNGWTKNIATGAASVPLWRSIAVALWITALGSAVIGLTTISGDPDSAGAELAACLGFFAAMGSVLYSARAVGRFAVWTWWAYVVPLVFFIVIFVRSWWRTRKCGEVEWKGRQLSVGHRAAARSGDT